MPNLALSDPAACQGLYDFNAFRTSEQSAFTFFTFEAFEMRNITSIDCHYGPTPYLQASNNKADMVLSDIWTHGEHPEAPQDNCPERIMAFLTPVVESMPQKLPIPKQPHDRLTVKNADVWGSIRATDLHFEGFLSNTVSKPADCAAKQYVFGRPMEDGMNGGPPVYMDRVTFKNVHDDAVAYLPKWHTTSKCSGALCTGPENVLYDVRTATLTGDTTPTSLASMTSSF